MCVGFVWTGQGLPGLEQVQERLAGEKFGVASTGDACKEFFLRKREIIDLS